MSYELVCWIPQTCPTILVQYHIYKLPQNRINNQLCIHQTCIWSRLLVHINKELKHGYKQHAASHTYFVYQTYKPYTTSHMSANCLDLCCWLVDYASTRNMTWLADKLQISTKISNIQTCRNTDYFIQIGYYSKKQS
jgi:hypothetical protein